MLVLVPVLVLMGKRHDAKFGVSMPIEETKKEKGDEG